MSGGCQASWFKLGFSHPPSLGIQTACWWERSEALKAGDERRATATQVPPITTTVEP